MIERFNFYDLYGYLLPGLMLIGIFWMPFMTITASLPSAELGSAFLLLGTAYLLGHVLHAISRDGLPSHLRLDENGDKFFPSDDELANGLPGAREDVIKKIEETFKLAEGQGANSRKVFSQCRSFLVATKRAAYAEQLHGMYALTRGITAAAIMGGAYFGGWVIGAYCSAASRECTSWVSGFLMAIFGLIAGGLSMRVVVEERTPLPNIKGEQPEDSKKRRREKARKSESKAKAVFWVTSLVIVSIGAVLANETSMEQVPETISFVGAGTVLLFLIAALAFRAYLRFARDFARTVYLDFLAATSAPPPAKDTA